MANSIGFLFQPASGDISINLLTQIFGNMGIVTNGGSLTLLGSMFSYFNSVILAVAALIIVYMTVMGVIHTAHEGEFMGKKWNSPFTIIRIVIGVAGLVPTPMGYSLIQILMMWVIMQGVGAADALWTSALNTIQTLGSPYNQLNATIVPIGINGQLQQLFQTITCDQTARSANTSPLNVKNGGYYCSGNNPPNWCNSSAVQNIATTPTSGAQSYLFGPNGQCGKLTLCSPKDVCAGTKATSTACATCLAQYPIMNTIVQNLTTAAQTFASVDYQYQYFYANSATEQTREASTPSWVTSYCNASPQNIPPNKCCVAGNTGLIKNAPLNPGACEASVPSSLPSIYNNGSPQNPSSDAVEDIYKIYSPLNTLFQATANTSGDFIDDNANLYTAAMTNAVGTSVTTQPTTSNPGANSNYASQGWIVAGAYYNQLAQKSGNNNANITLPTITLTTISTSNNDAINKVRNNYQGAGFLMGIGVAGLAQATINDGSKTVMNAFTSMPNLSNGASNDPILGLMIAGTTILFTLQVTVGVLLFLWLGLSIGASILPYVLGTGIGNPINTPTVTASILLAPFLFGAVIYLISIGGLLSIYVPLIPYIVFSLGAIGWMVGVIETIVAAPLVALGIIIPAGEHELLGQAKPALMMLFNVFLRPCLMLFGLFTAMLLARVAIQFINYTFWGPVWQYYGQFVGGGLLLGFFMMLAAYVMLVISVLNKCFSLIYHLPDTVLSWIGGQGSPGGRETGEGALKESKSGVEAVGSQAGSGLKGAAKEKKKDDAAAAKAKTKLAASNNAANNNPPQGPNQNNNNNNNNNNNQN